MNANDNLQATAELIQKLKRESVPLRGPYAVRDKMVAVEAMPASAGGNRQQRRADRALARKRA